MRINHFCPMSFFMCVCVCVFFPSLKKKNDWHKKDKSGYCKHRYYFIFWPYLAVFCLTGIAPLSAKEDSRLCLPGQRMLHQLSSLMVRLTCSSSQRWWGGVGCANGVDGWGGDGDGEPLIVTKCLSSFNHPKPSDKQANTQLSCGRDNQNIK